MISNYPTPNSGGKVYGQLMDASTGVAAMMVLLLAPKGPKASVLEAPGCWVGGLESPEFAWGAVEGLSLGGSGVVTLVWGLWSDSEGVPGSVPSSLFPSYRNRQSFSTLTLERLLCAALPSFLAAG